MGQGMGRQNAAKVPPKSQVKVTAATQPGTVQSGTVQSGTIHRGNGTGQEEPKRSRKQSQPGGRGVRRIGRLPLRVAVQDLRILPLYGIPRRI